MKNISSSTLDDFIKNKIKQKNKLIKIYRQALKEYANEKNWYHDLGVNCDAIWNYGKDCCYNEGYRLSQEALRKSRKD